MSDREQIVEALRATGGTVDSNGKITGGKLDVVAQKLGIARKTLYNRMKALGLKGTSGRPKKKFGSRARGYATVATVAVLGGAILLANRSKTSA